MTQWGRYKYLRSPMGFSATGDDYARKSDVVFEGMNQIVKVVDDLAAFDATFQEHVNTVRDILSRCRRHGVTLNAKKFKFGQPEVEFAGFRLSQAGVGADPEKLAAVARFLRPTNSWDWWNNSPTSPATSARWQAHSVRY